MGADLRFPITKLDPDRRTFGGWAYVAKDRDGNIVIDHSGDFVDDDAWPELVDAFYQYALDGRAGDEMHQSFGVSKLAEFFVSDEERWEQLGIPEGSLPKGIFVSYYAEDDDLWNKIKDGTYTALSIVGVGSREPV